VKRLLAIMALVGCAATPPPCETCASQPAEVEVSVCVDSAFTASEVGSANEACAAWTSALCGLVTLRPLTVPGDAPPAWCDLVVLRVESDYDWVAARGSSTGAFCDAIGGRTAWIVADRIPDGRLEATFAHELGHLLGVTHGAEAMSPALRDDTQCIDRRAAVLAAVKTSAARASRCEVRP